MFSRFMDIGAKRITKEHTMNIARTSNTIKDYYRGQRCLVTGGAGFIGSHIVEALVKCGARVRAMVHYNSRDSVGNLEFVEKSILGDIEIFAADISDPYSVLHAVEGYNIVFHLASLIGVPYSYRAPQQYVRTNVMGTLNILEACRRHNIEKLVHTSTSETYGSARYTPMDEDHPLQGQSPYAASKIGADKLAESYFLSFELPAVTIRPFNTFGPRQSARAIIPTLITQALTSEKIRVGNLAPMRDFNYVSDTVMGFLSVGACRGAVGEVVNVGSGRCVSVGETIEIMQKLLGTNKEVIVDENRVRPKMSEVMKLQCDNGKIKKLTGWSPEVKLEDGLRMTIDWVKENSHLFEPSEYVI